MLRRGRDLSQPFEKLEFTIRDKKRERLDRALQRHLGWESRSKVQKLIHLGRVLVNNERPKVATRVGPGDAVVIDLVTEDSGGSTEETIVRPFWEDPYLLAVDKPPHVLVHPVGRTLRGTIIDGLHAHYRSANHRGTRPVVPKLCHRLDRETSGLLLIAKVDRARRELSDAFEHLRVQKRYLAVVEGDPDQDAFEVDARISADLDRTRSAGNRLAKADPRGKPARTEFVVRERAGLFSIVECRPRTGRQNQIRIHLAEAGHPIVGDVGYGAQEARVHADLESEPGRALLHSWSLEFRHPIWNTAMRLETEIARDFLPYLAAR